MTPDVIAIIGEFENQRTNIRHIQTIAVCETVEIARETMHMIFQGGILHILEGWRGLSEEEYNALDGCRFICLADESPDGTEIYMYGHASTVQHLYVRLACGPAPYLTDPKPSADLYA